MEEKINKCFINYFTKLYRRGPETEQEIINYLKGKQIPKINENKMEQLNAPISIMELHQVITNLKLGKAPGPDRLPAIHYKKLEDVLEE